MIGTNSGRNAEPPRRVQIDALRMDVRARAELSGEALAEYAKAMNASARFPLVAHQATGPIMGMAAPHAQGRMALHAMLRPSGAPAKTGAAAKQFCGPSAAWLDLGGSLTSATHETAALAGTARPPAGGAA